MSARSSVNLWRVLSDTTRVINAHPRHFLALSVLFILPSPSLPSSTLLFSIHIQTRSMAIIIATRVTCCPWHDPSNPMPVIKPHQASSSNTYASSYRSSSASAPLLPSPTPPSTEFYGEPVKFISSIKSILFSFFPLLATMIVMGIIFALILFAFTLLIFLAYYLVSSFGVVIGYDSLSSVMIIFAVLLFGVMIYLQSKWYLSNAVVILESEWGYSPLKRSSYLVKGQKGVVLSTLFFFGVLSVLLSVLTVNLVSNPGGWCSWGFVLKAVVYTVFWTALSLYGRVANTVLFVHCQAKHGEAVSEIANEKFGNEYAMLPFEDGKDTYVVTVV